MSDYRISHQPRPDGTPLHLAACVAFPDLRRHTGAYATTRAEYRCASIIQTAYERPDLPVTIFRAVPRGLPFSQHVINPGDWVTLSRTYAEDHAKHPTDPAQDGIVIYIRVPASTLRTDGDSVCEFGYFPDAS